MELRLYSGGLFKTPLVGQSYMAAACVEGFNTYIQRYKALLSVEKTALEVL